MVETGGEAASSDQPCLYLNVGGEGTTSSQKVPKEGVQSAWNFPSMVSFHLNTDINCISCIFLQWLPRVWKSATLSRAKTNNWSWLPLIWPSGAEDLVFIKNREDYISSSCDFITSGYSTEADHTQSADLKLFLWLLAQPTIWIWGFCRILGLFLPKMHRSGLY